MALTPADLMPAISATNNASSLNAQEFELFREYIEKQCGIALGKEKAYLVESRLAKLVVESGCENFSDFYKKVRSGLDLALKTKVIDAMTTNETLWFRDESPFTLLKTQILPEFQAQLAAGKKHQLRIWSAACSTGQEPYSIVMTVKEFDAEHAGKAGKPPVYPALKILATDISSSALMLAKMARYDGISIARGLPEAYKEKYFENQGRVFSLKDEIKQPVEFKSFNLQDSVFPLGKFDVIFLRNVAIYFSADFKTELFGKLVTALNPSGYLILGASESINGYSKAFETKLFERGTLYQLKEAP
ncbi:MAG: protein-glutamate O-methyltransferase CheR [Vampirovibrionales bacterium]|nr:protein-glutamate O-methyltransferase CheR [Vampirovibrionales bacterium]